MVHPEDQLVGRVLGGYRIDEVLSTSPMGKVYKAFQLSVERYVALKFLASALLDNSEVREAFVAGAKAAASLNHRNIVRVHDVCREEGYLFYSMEYVGGGSFRDRIRVKALPTSAWPGVLWGATSGLLHAQQKGVFHPQLVPEHFLFSETGEVKILNLGLAASMEPVRRKLGVRFHDWVFYSPPEEEGSRGRRQGEVFTAGCALYHVMAGEPPFAGTTVEQVTARKLSRDPMGLQQRASMASAEVSAIVERMIERDCGLRYSDFSEMNDEVSIHCEPSSEGAYSGRKVIALALSVLVLVAAAWFLFRAGDVEEPSPGEMASPSLTPAREESSAGSSAGKTAEPAQKPVREPEPAVARVSPPVSKPVKKARPPGTEEGKPGVKVPAPLAPPDKSGLEFSELVKRGDDWRVFLGRISPPARWNQPAFDDSGWDSKPSGFGYSSSESELTTVKTRLDDMPTEGYLTVFIRKSFQVEDPAEVSKFRLKLLIDDGFVAYLNGVEVARHNMKAGIPAFDKPADYIENPEGDLRSYDLRKHLPLLHPGSNVIAIQGHNQSLTSTDFVLTPTLEVLTTRRGLSPGELADLQLELSLKAEEQVGGYLKLRDYRRALDSIEDLEFRFKGYQELEKWEKKVLAGIESDLEVTLLRAENLLELGEFEEIRELVTDFNSRTPRKYRKRIQPILDAVTLGEGIAQGAVETVARAQVAVLVAIEKGNFDAGARVLDRIPAVPGKSLREGIDRATMALETSRWAWEKILLGLRKYRGKRALLVPVEPAGEDGVVPALWLQSYKKPDGVEVPLVFQRKSGELYKCDLIDLPLPALLAFLGAGVARNEPGELDRVMEVYGAEAGVIGIELLLLCRKGPRSALENLAFVAEQERAGLEEGINYLGKRLLESSLAQAS
ncbi:MAG: protein kinase, partial [Planctomycetota bacterium]|nr:protein kinase [Planctomycetota bacterium]